jgi:hypothetical protein
MTAQDWELGRLFSFVDILAKLVAKSYTGDSNSQESHKNANNIQGQSITPSAIE